jgi:hypothetical protein
MDRDLVFDIVSHGRRGPGRRDRLTLPQVEQILRTVRGVPEVMVKVSGSSSSARKAIAHMAYIGRVGNLEIETDDGQHLSGPSAAKSLSDSWQLGIDQLVARTPYKASAGQRGTKLTHHIVLSMPAQTPPDCLLEAAKGFARDEFSLQHRYAMVLHTDQDHPHVHLVVRAMGDNGRRLRIDKQKLRDWRTQFAEQLRAQGVEANATSALVRGRLSKHQRNGLYRAATRGAARAIWKKERVGQPAERTISPKAAATQKAVQDAWQEIGRILLSEANDSLANEVERLRRRIGPRSAARTIDYDLTR